MYQMAQAADLGLSRIRAGLVRGAGASAGGGVVMTASGKRHSQTKVLCGMKEMAPFTKGAILPQRTSAR